MFVDKDIVNKKEIINEIKIKKTFTADEDKIETLQHRYKNWKNIYFTNKTISKSFYNY